MPPEIKPEIKILFYLLFVLFLYLIRNPVYLVALSVPVIFFMLRIPFKRLKAGWIPITLFLFFTLVSNLLNQHGRILASAGPFFITEEGLNAASLRTLRLFLMIGGLKALMAGTETEALVGGLGRLFMPLEKLGLPVRDFVHTMGLTLRCFPVLTEMGAKLYREQSELNEVRGFSGRVKVVSSFMVPMFVRSVLSPEIFFEKGETDGKQA